MSRVRYILLAIFLLLVHVGVHGQYFKKIGMKEGLSNPSVLAIYQDTLGRMWFGTNEGVNIYDGNQILKYKSYEVYKGQTSYRKIVNGLVNQIVGNRKGDVFIRNNGDLIKYDIRQETFTELHLRHAGALTTVKGEVWCAIRDSLFRHDSETDSLYFYRKLNTPVVWCLESVGERMYVGTAQGLYVLEGDSVKSILPDIEIFKVFLSSRKELWIATRMHGLYKIGRDGVLRKEEYSPSRVVSRQIRGFVEDEQQNIWFGTFDGLQVYNPYSDTYRVYRPDGQPGSLEHQSVFSIYKDKQGSIWVGTYYGGVNYFNLSKDIFTYYAYNKANKDCLNFPIAGQIIEDDDHDLWIATDGGGINLLSRKEGVFTHYMSGTHSILHNNVKTMAYDKRHDCIYIGTYTGGMSRYDRKQRTFYNYLTHAKAGEGPNHIIYHTLFKDDYLYVTARNGFWRLNPVDGKFELLNKQELFLTFEADSHGYIWLATGFSLYRVKEGDWEHLEEIDLGESSHHAKVTRIKEATDGTIYVATLGGGLFSFSYETKKWKHYTKEKNHLLSDFCYNLTETSMNNILVTCDKGISIYSPFNDSSSFIDLGLKGGISAITEGCGICVAEDETIYVGGVDGMISFREKDLYSDESSKFDLYFSDLYINNVKVAPNDGHNVLSHILAFTKRLDLAYDQKNFMVTFSNSNYVESERKNEYLYKLEGFDKEWIETSQLQVNYTNLAPGDYVLKVRQPGSEWKNGKDVEITLDIKIHRPWFGTVWAFLFYLAVVASIIYCFWRVRKARLVLAMSLAEEKDEKERIAEINKMKLRFFTNISHEFRTPLTLIVGQVEMLLQLEKFPASVNRKLRGIHKNAMSLRSLITELLDFRKLEQGFMRLKVGRINAVSFVKDIYMQFADYARKRNITYTFECADEEIDVWLDPVQMQKVLFNLLSNAFKYTEDGKSIRVVVKKTSKKVEISVMDTGCGIPQKSIEKIFERFYQVDDSLPKLFLGSGIGLALTKGIVEIHKGEIEVDSVVGEGSCFKILLLTGYEHFSEEELEHEKVIQATSDWNDMIVDAGILPGEEKEEEDSVSSVSDKPTILLVEDDEEMLNMLEDTFQPNYTVYKAENGQKGYEQAMQLHPDIIVSDVMMPVMSGKEMCYKIKNNLELTYIPVILLTAQVSDDYTIEGYMFGADDYIAKPFNVKLLLARCANLLKNKQLLLKKVARSEKSLLQDAGNLNGADQKVLEAATEIIKRNFDNPEFDMNMLAAELNIGRSKMFARLKEVTGLTPNEFALKLKLEEALKMLQEETQYNISEISYHLGFTSPRYFSRCFKAFYGVSPLTYRKNPSKGEEDLNALDE